MSRTENLVRGAGLAAALLLAACSTSPPVPNWQANSKAALDRAIAAYMAGDTRVASVEFDLARRELASTGRADQVALAELTRCAVRVASLEVGLCEGFERLRPEATAAERAYADYLSNRAQPQDIAMLPEQHRSIAASGLSGDTAVAALKAIDDPLARLGATRGWVRADLLPWIDGMATALATGAVYYPTAYDENGQRVIGNTLSGMGNTNALYRGQNCNDWTDAGLNASHGHTHAGGKGWPSNNVGVSSCAIASWRAHRSVPPRGRRTSAP